VVRAVLSIQDGVLLLHPPEERNAMSAYVGKERRGEKAKLPPSGKPFNKAYPLT
jgi:hypothetical protein